MASAQHTTLRGWKEIATYVGRDVRTVQRWESQRGFPVRRLPGAEGGNVYALASEVDEWLHPSKKEQADVVKEQAAAVKEQAVPVTPPGEPPPALISPTSAPGSVSLVPTHRVAYGRRPVWRVAAGFGVLAAALVLVTLLSFRFQKGRAQERTLPVRAGGPEHYVSSVPGVDALYMQGMYLFEKRTPDSLFGAKRMLSAATARDTNDAPAWSGLAQALTLLVAYGIETDAEGKMHVRDAARRALELDSELAEPYAVLGFADAFWQGDVQAAESEFQTALRINPHSALARNWYGTFLTYEARYPEALEQLNTAQRLQPSSTAILGNRALALGLSGHREEAFQLLKQVGDENLISSVRFNRALLSLVRPVDPALFLQEEMELATVSHADDRYRSFAAARDAYQRGGETAMWRSLLADGERGRVDLLLIASAHAALGENDAAFEALTEAQRQSIRLVGIAMDPRLLPLHRDPRFNRLLGEQGLPPVSEHAGL